jgi:tellurite resistance protein
MPLPPINPDARNLEDAFFAQENSKLLADMRQKAELQERRAALREAVKGADDALLDHLLALGVKAETVLAMTLLPLARVAWADGSIDAKERAAVLQAAEIRGVHPATPGHDLLATWLAHKPGEAMVTAWNKYVAGIWPSLTPHERDDLRERLLGLARGVAEAAGGFLGLGSKISPAERAVLDEIEAALRRE